MGPHVSDVALQRFDPPLVGGSAGDEVLGDRHRGDGTPASSSRSSRSSRSRSSRCRCRTRPPAPTTLVVELTATGLAKRSSRSSKIASTRSAWVNSTLMVTLVGSVVIHLRGTMSTMAYEYFAARQRVQRLAPSTAARFGDHDTRSGEGFTDRGGRASPARRRPLRARRGRSARVRPTRVRAPERLYPNLLDPRQPARKQSRDR